MKISKAFVTYDMDDSHLLVPVGEHPFSGLVKGNATTAFIIQMLKEDTTVETMEDKMMDHYGIDRETAGRDIEKVLAALRKVGALDE